MVVTATDFANSRAFFTRRRPTNTERGWAVVVDPGPWWKWKKHRCLDPAAPRINHGRTTCLLSCHTPTTHTGGSYLNSLSLSLSPPLCSLLAFSFSVNFPFGVFRVPSLDSRFRESTVRCRLLCVGYEEQSVVCCCDARYINIIRLIFVEFRRVVKRFIKADARCTPRRGRDIARYLSRCRI